jgi:hypothetical protein
MKNKDPLRRIFIVESAGLPVQRQFLQAAVPAVLMDGTVGIQIGLRGQADAAVRGSVPRGTG